MHKFDSGTMNVGLLRYDRYHMIVWIYAKSSPNPLCLEKFVGHFCLSITSFGFTGIKSTANKLSHNDLHATPKDGGGGWRPN